MTQPGTIAQGSGALPLPQVLSEVGLSQAPGATFLKLFVPPLFDGAYLAFDAAGEAVGVVDGPGTALLEAARGVPAEALLRDGQGAIDGARLALVERFLALGLLAAVPPGEDRSAEAHWIRPDTAPQTRHTGPGADRFIRAFYGYFGGAFHDGSVLIDSHGEFLEAVARYFPRTPGLECLDAGCGSGHYTAALARLGHTVYACDISRTRLEASAAKPAAPGRIVPVETDVADIPLPDASLDFAMCNFVLEHVADPFAVIDELLRLLKPGGTMLLAVPSFNVRDTLAYWLYDEPPSLNFEHLRSYGLIPHTHPWCAVTTDTLAHIERHGASVLAVEGTGVLDGLWEPWLSAVEALAARRGPGFATQWPWNCLGRQTIVHARKQGGGHAG